VVLITLEIDTRRATAQLSNRAGVMTGTAMLRIRAEVDDTFASTTTALPQADFLAIFRLIADLVTAPLAHATVVGVQGEIDALTSAARFIGRARLLAAPAMLRVVLQIAAPAVTRCVAVAAKTFPFLAASAWATVGIALTWFPPHRARA
jgi:hypothetical protein